MDFTLNLPINSVSFGQVSFAILREIYQKGLNPSLLPIGNVDLSTHEQDTDFVNWLNSCITKYYFHHSRDIPCIKLWHLSGSHESISKKQILVSFYELDSPTIYEQNIVKGNVTVFTNKYTVDVFEKVGIETNYIPLGFDNKSFCKLDKKYFDDDRITFNLCGKIERRKNQVRVIRSWLKRFGNDKRYSLQAACFNPFLSKEDNAKVINSALDGKSYFNFNSVEWMQKNSMFNDFVNSGDIIIGMSSGEGWGIPEFSSVAIGKHSVILNAHAYQTWANNKNSVFVEPKEEKIECYDNIFFKKGMTTNQGNYFNYDEDAFIEGCEKAIARVQSNRVNIEGLKLQEEFSYAKTVEGLLNLL